MFLSYSIIPYNFAVVNRRIYLLLFVFVFPAKSVAIRNIIISDNAESRIKKRTSSSGSFPSKHPSKRLPYCFVRWMLDLFHAFVQEFRVRVCVVDDLFQRFDLRFQRCDLGVFRFHHARFAPILLSFHFWRCFGFLNITFIFWRGRAIAWRATLLKTFG